MQQNTGDSGGSNSSSNVKDAVFGAFCSALLRQLQNGQSIRGSEAEGGAPAECILRPGRQRSAKQRTGRVEDDHSAASQRITLDELETCSVPSAHNAFALARYLLLKYDLDEALPETLSIQRWRTLGLSSPVSCESPALYPPLVRMGVSCMFDFLRDLGQKDVQLGHRAISPLFSMLEGLAPGELAVDSPSLLDDLFSLFKTLAESGSEDLAGLAVSGLIALSVAAGNPDFVMETASLLISRPLADATVDNIRIPENFRILYRSLAHVVGLNGPGKGPSESSTTTFTCFSKTGTWLNTSIRQVHSFQIELPSTSADSQAETCPVVPHALTSDGKFLYVVSNFGLLKLGTGCADSVQGMVYAQNAEIFKKDQSHSAEKIFVAIYGSNILIRRRNSTTVRVIECETLYETGEVLLQTTVTDGVLCSLQGALYLLRIDAENNLVLYRIDDNFMLCHNPELKLRLTQKKYIAFGEHSNLDIPVLLGSLRNRLEDRIKDVKIGKDLALLLTDGGKVYFVGKGSLLGLSDNRNSWTELILPDMAEEISLGLCGNHVLIRTSNGHVYFAGTATRGEDGEKLGMRQQATSSKAKRLVVPKSKKVVSVSSNTGSSAFVTSDGALYIYGKDTQCSSSSGQVQGIDSPVAQVALGRAHCVALTRNGHVYSFGMNTFGQCGRTEVTYGAQSRGSPARSAGSSGSPGRSGVTSGETSDSDRSSRTDDDMPTERSRSSTPLASCPANAHVWRSSGGWCSKCGRCSVHGSVCPRASPRRVIGSLKNTAVERLLTTCRAAEGQSVEGPCVKCGLCKTCSTDISPRHGVLSSGDGGRSSTARDSDSDSRVSELTVFPGRVIIKGQYNLKITQVACGNYHTLLLSADGNVITFGSNRYGQLGVGDFRAHAGPQIIQSPTQVVQIAAGAYHSVIRTKSGAVYTFGKNNCGQLCRDPQDERSLALPEPIDGFDPGSDRRASWICAAAEATVIKYDLCILSNESIRDATAVGNSRYLMIFPRAHSPTSFRPRAEFTYLVVDRVTGHSKHFKCDALGPPQELAICMDHRYDVVWFYNRESGSLQCFSPDLANMQSSCFIGDVTLSEPEFWLPAESRQLASPQHLGLSLLVLYHLLISYRSCQLRMDFSGSQTSGRPGVSPVEEYACVDRFQSYGGGWGYSAQSVEAIQFMCEQTISVTGFGLLGGRGEYTARIRLLRLIGNSEGDAADDQNVELVGESEEAMYTCQPREKHHAFLKKPVTCQAEEWYVVCVSINGPSSDCGSSGLPLVVTEDGLTFHFKNSRLSNNGTDIHAGQIAQILFRPLASDDSPNSGHPRNKASMGSQQPPWSSTVHFPPDQLKYKMNQLSQKFVAYVSSRCMTALLQTATHATEHTMQYSIHPDLIHVSDRLITVNTLCVHLLEHYLLNVYPDPNLASRSPQQESKEMVALIEETFLMVVNMFSCANNLILSAKRKNLITAAIGLIRSAFHVYFPTPDVVRVQLLALLQYKNRNDWLLCAMLKGLSSQPRPVAHMVAPTTRPTSSLRQHDYPVLKSFVNRARRSNLVADHAKESFDLQNVLHAILKFVFDLENPTSVVSPPSDFLRQYLQKAASSFVLKTTSDLVRLSASPSVASTSVVLQTPSRFVRLSTTTSWDTSNGAPDAIAFQVDMKCVSIHGVGVYVGVGAAYTYSLELLVNCGDSTLEHWQLLEKVSGNLCAGTDGELAFLKLNKPVRLVPFIQYAFRVQLTGNRTWGGESGQVSVVGFRGVQFTFSSCSLSINGTNVARGQIPIILYSVETDYNLRLVGQEKAASWVMALLKQVATQLQKLCVPSSAKDLLKPNQRQLNLFTFLRYYFGLISLFLHQCPTFALDCLRVLDDLLPVICSAQQPGQVQRKKSGRKPSTVHVSPSGQNFVQAVVESNPAQNSCGINSTFVNFEDVVKYMVVEFDAASATCQAEDSLQLFVITPDDSMISVAKYTGVNWSRRSLVLPGNALWFVLETATSPNKEPAPDTTGYKCTVTGIIEPKDSLLETLECELSHLSALCSQIILSDESTKTMLRLESSFDQSEADELLLDHGDILRKGLRLAHQPSIYELKKTGKLPPPPSCAIAKFLQDFANAVATTTAGKLAQWLMPVPYLDLAQCELQVDCGAMPQVQSGRPLVITVTTKDQYGRVAVVPNLVIDITLLAASDPRGGDGSSQRVCQTTSFQPTYLNRARYCSITMMQAYQNLSFEELRLAHCYEMALRTNLTVSTNNDGLYTATWVPKKSGLYEIDCKVDGYPLQKQQRIEVQNGRVISKSKDMRLVKALSKLRMATARADLTQGVRIRSSPSLFAEQAGVVTPGGVIFYTEEVENTEGTWLRLSDETALMFCPGIANPMNAWVLQYHSALNRSLMYVEDEPSRDTNATPSAVGSDSAPTQDTTAHSVIVACDERYFVVRIPDTTEEGLAGRLPLRDSPRPTGKVVGSLSLDDEITTVGWLQNAEGIWVQLSKTSFDHHSYGKSSSAGTSTSSTTAFAQVQPASENIVYLERILTPENGGSWTSERKTASNPFVFGLSSSRQKIKRSKPTAKVAPQSHISAGSPSQAPPVTYALAPSIAICARYAFCSLLWHSGATHDAVACATYLKFHEELQGLRSDMNTSGVHPEDSATEAMQDLDDYNVPTALRLLLQLWREIYEAVMTIVSQHLILPSPPMAIKAGVQDGFNQNSNDCYCELCEGWFSHPVTSHMKSAHPGCGVHAGGQGYNSLGRYSSGWSGSCGEGGHGAAVWYLMCAKCRQGYMKNTGTYRERQKKNRGRFFRSSNAIDSPQTIIKNNASFLLDLNSSCGVVSPADWQPPATSVSRNEWSVTMFPQVITSPPRLSSRSSSISGYQSNDSILGGPSAPQQVLELKKSDAQCASDPGPRIARADSDNLVAYKSSWPTINDEHRDVNTTSTNLISSPSPSLKTATEKLDIGNVANTNVTLNSTLRRPVMSFLIKHHDLNWIRSAMELSVARSAALTHTFQVLSWILRLLNSNQAIHGVLCQFVEALRLKRRHSNDAGDLISHPLTLIPFAGPCGFPVLYHFHNFLTTVANLLNGHRQMNIEEQRLCLQVWSVRFSNVDHGLILKCRILNTVNRILSGGGIPQQGPSRCGDSNDRVTIEATEDVTSCMTLDASSRKAMLPCLLDGTTETFWESGEEDRNRSKWLFVTIPTEGVQPVLLSLYIDNVKDSTNRVYQVVFFTVDTDGKNKKRVKSQSLTARFTGWVKCVAGGHLTNFQVELKSQDHFVRVRQVHLCGHWQRPPQGHLRKSSSYQQHFSSIQSDAFKVFKLITLHAFGDQADPSGTDMALRNVVFDMAFNGRGPTHGLQGYVVRQIVSALEKEIALLKEGVKNNYSYCSGLMTMLDKVASFSLGCECLKGKQNLLYSLASLLLFAPSAIQLTVLQLLKKLFNIFEPFTLDHQRFLNTVLIPVAKILTIQLKEAAKRQSVTSVSAANSLVASWHFHKHPTIEITSEIITLLRETASDHFGSLWSTHMRGLCGSHILALALLPPEARTSQALLSNVPFWLAMASLTVIEDESWLQDSPLQPALTPSAREQTARTLAPCDNHDDGQTMSAVYCRTCDMSLCRDCNVVFHLSEKRRQHDQQVLQEQEDDPLQLTIKETSARLKLPWLMALTDSGTMNGIVEFREDRHALVAGQRDTCRFCARPVDPDLLLICSTAECAQLNATACPKLLSCGHRCSGIAGEVDCPPCLRCGSPQLRQDGDDMCMICFTDTLSAAPVVLMACGHAFHSHCVRTVLERRWPGPRITFAFLHCPICKAQIAHPSVEDLLAGLQGLIDDVTKKALMRLEYDGLRNSPTLTDPESPYYKDPQAYAQDRYAYYVCYTCGRAYYGGEAHCAAAASNLDFDPKELLCGACSNVTQAQICPKHGTDYLEYKCRYCCSIAVFFCFGTTHFCGACHDDFQRLSALPKHVLPPCPVGPRSTPLTDATGCPLQVNHPPTGEEFALGCGICRNIQTF